MSTAKQIIADAARNWDDCCTAEPPYRIEDAIRENMNCREASVDDDGAVYISDPQMGHHLSYNEMENLVGWMRGMGMIPPTI
jgi:hypothetical protein